MRVLFVSSEAYPLAKTGGLADVSGSLPAALASFGLDVRLLIPAYPMALDRLANPHSVADLGEDVRVGPMRLIGGRMPDSGVPVWLLDCPHLFRRAGRLYTDENGRDWPDNARRFAVFNHVAMRLARGLRGIAWRPDVVHANDWHAGLTPALLKTLPANDRPASLFTIHNIAFQGLFPPGVFPELGLAPAAFSPGGVEYYNQVSFLKAGIRYADEVTTVSPTYAREIASSELGFGLQGVLSERLEHLSGILNGVDYGTWDPAHDHHLPCRYDVGNLANKGECKRRIREEFGLDPDPEVPLIAFISRLTGQKMADVVLEALPWLDRQKAQLAVVGQGEPDIERAFREAGAGRNGRVAVHVGYDEPVAHRVLAGADMLLAPARFEPCGLTQMYALRYGTVPLVRATGGLSDTVVDVGARNIRRDIATGYRFRDATLAAMTGCIARALEGFRQPALWRHIQRAGMKQDFGWPQSAARYLAICDRLLGAASGVSRLRASAVRGDDYVGEPLAQQEGE